MLPTYEELFQAVRELTAENEKLQQEIVKLQENRLPLFMSASDIAKELCVSRQVAYNLMAQPGFPAFKLGESSKSNKRVRRDDFLAWQKSRMNKGA